MSGLIILHRYRENAISTQVENNVSGFGLISNINRRLSHFQPGLKNQLLLIAPQPFEIMDNIAKAMASRLKKKFGLVQTKG